MSSRFEVRIKCRDLELVHKSTQYKTSKRRFFKLEEILQELQPLFPNLLLQSEDEVCDYCYYKLLNKITQSKAALSQSSEASQPSVESQPCGESQPSPESRSTSSKDNSCKLLLDLNNSDQSFVPETNSEDFNELNDKLGLYSSAVSPLKPANEVNIEYRINYAARKRKEIGEMQYSQLSTKIRKLYDINDNSQFDLATLKLSDCQSCRCWFDNFGSSLDNCSSTSEKIRLLSAAPINHFSKTYMLSKWPGVSDYMLRKARKIVNEKGNYCSPDPYLGHQIEESVQKAAVEYFLSDDLNCSTQSPNKNDIIHVKENGEKVVKIKRYMLRSIHETYKIFQRDNSNMKIGHSKFYSLRPRWVVQCPTQQVCLCIYCTNFELLLVGLKNFSEKCGVKIENRRDTILSAAVCSVNIDKCIFKECKECPGVDGVIQTLTRLFAEDIEQEITYAFWEDNDLIKKTTMIEIFIKTIAEWTLKVNTHLRCKEIQQKGIKEEKDLSKQNPSHLILHVDFAENWSVIVSNEIQSYHWKSKQVSVFTAVCYIGHTTESYVVVSDDLCHDASHALLGIDKIVNDLQQKFPELIVREITIITDGAPSHFKNRYQLYEFKTSTINKKWIFSATGHGKGACDGIGGIVKHFATRHNLTQPPTEYIQCARTFVQNVQTKTPNISHLLLDLPELEQFRQEKLRIWKKVKGFKGIRRTHVWKFDAEENKVYTAKTCEHELELLK